MSAAPTTAGIAGRTRRPAGRLQTIIVIAVTVIGIGAAAFLFGGGGSSGVTDVTLTGNVAGAAPTVGAVPPGFSATTYDGKKISLSDYAGKPLWLTFGASWCPDCRTEAPDVEAAFQKYQGKGLNLLAVFISETQSDVASYAGKAGLTFPIVVDQMTNIASLYRTMGIPTHFFIGADGTIKQVVIGALQPDEIDRAVAAILN